MRFSGNHLVRVETALLAGNQKRATPQGKADSMKVYIVYVDGIEQPTYIRASGHSAAERKAAKLYPGHNVQVCYTEV